MSNADDPASDAERLIAHVLQHLGPPPTWLPMVPRYPDSLALCIIDSVWSLGVRYGSVTNVVGHYRRSRREQGADPDHDDVADLISRWERAGGAEEFAALVHNRQKVSTASGAILKAQAVYSAARALRDAGIDSRDDLRAAVAQGGEAGVKGLWLAVPGQRSGLSWEYLLMLAGLPRVKADRMICRFVARALARLDVPPAVAANQIVRAAELLETSPTTLDHEIWRYERRQRPAGRSEAAGCAVPDTRSRKAKA
jgi:hypothetical protein